MRALILSGFFLMLFSSSPGVAEELTVGDPAPAIEVKKFVKGEPVKELAKGKIYVVEFWATWCPPCRSSIPHLTQLQKKYKDVVFIGVSNEDQDTVEPFVKEMGDKMEYRVALDKSVGKKDDGGAMNKSWMEAANQNGIPTSFIVEKTGKIAWIGHPMELDKQLVKVTSDKFDIKVATESFKKAKLRETTLAKLMREAMAAKKDGDTKTVLEKIDKLIAEDPDAEEKLALPKFILMVSDKEPNVEKAVAYGQKLLTSLYKDEAEELNALAWTLCDPREEKKPAPKLAQFAVKCAQRADELTEKKDPEVADTLARAYFVSGDLDKAIETGKRAVKLVNSKEQVKELQKHLDEYREAKKKAKE